MSDQERNLRSNRTITMLLIIIIIMLSAFFIFGFTNNQNEKNTSMGNSQEYIPRWEYYIRGIRDSTWTTEMDLLGKNGWELITARRAQDSKGDMQYECIFKRPFIAK